MIQTCQNHCGNAGKQARPKVIQHHPRRIVAAVGAADDPWLPDVKQPKQRKGKDPSRPWQPAHVSAAPKPCHLVTPRPKGGGGEQQRQPLASHFVNHHFGRVLAGVKFDSAGPKPQGRDQQGRQNQGGEACNLQNPHPQQQRHG